MLDRAQEGFVNLGSARQSKMPPTERDHCTPCKTSEEGPFCKASAGPNPENLKERGKKTMLSVSAIQNGTVIDHIRHGQGLRILRLLKIQNSAPVTLGLKLKSSSIGWKDLIKVEDVHLTKEQTDQIALFSPEASINVIREYEIISKYKVELPEEFDEILQCPNSRCITRLERTVSSFSVIAIREQIHLLCRFCEKIHRQTEIE